MTDKMTHSSGTHFQDGSHTFAGNNAFGNQSHQNNGGPLAGAQTRPQSILNNLRLSKDCDLFQFQTRRRIENIQNMSFQRRNGKALFSIETMDTTTQTVVTAASLKQTCHGLSVTLTTANGKFSLASPNWQELNTVLEYLSSSVKIEPLNGNRDNGRRNQSNWKHNINEIESSSSGFGFPSSSFLLKSKDGNNNNNGALRRAHPSFWEMHSRNGSARDNNSNNNNNNSNHSSFGDNNDQVSGQGQGQGQLPPKLEFNTGSFGSASMNGNVLHLQRQQVHKGYEHKLQLNHCLDASVAGRYMNRVRSVEFGYDMGEKEYYCKVNPRPDLEVDTDMSAMQFAFPIVSDYIHCQSSNIESISFFDNKKDYLENLNYVSNLACGGMSLRLFSNFMFKLWFNRNMSFDRSYYWKHKMFVKLQENNKQEEKDDNNNNGNNGNMNRNEKPFLSLFEKKLHDLDKDFESQLKIVLLGINGDLNNNSFEQIRRDLSSNHNNLDTKAGELLIQFYKNNRDICDDYNLSILEALFGITYAFGVMVVTSFDVLTSLNMKENEYENLNDNDIDIDENEVFEINIKKYFNASKINIARQYSILWNKSIKINGKAERDTSVDLENEIMAGEGGISK